MADSETLASATESGAETSLGDFRISHKNTAKTGTIKNIPEDSAANYRQSSPSAPIFVFPFDQLIKKRIRPATRPTPSQIYISV